MAFSSDPIFSGTDPEAWISVMERCFVNCQIHPTHHVAFAMKYLDGEALTWARPREILFLEKGWGYFAYRLLWEFVTPYWEDWDNAQCSYEVQGSWSGTGEVTTDLIPDELLDELVKGSPQTSVEEVVHAVKLGEEDRVLLKEILATCEKIQKILGRPSNILSHKSSESVALELKTEVNRLSVVSVDDQEDEDMLVGFENANTETEVVAKDDGVMNADFSSARTEMQSIAVDEGELGEEGSLDVSQYHGNLKSPGEDTTQARDNISTYDEVTSQGNDVSYYWEPGSTYEEHNQFQSEEEVGENSVLGSPSYNSVVTEVVTDADVEPIFSDKSQMQAFSYDQVPSNIVTESSLTSPCKVLLEKGSLRSEENSDFSCSRESTLTIADTVPSVLVAVSEKDVSTNEIEDVGDSIHQMLEMESKGTQEASSCLHIDGIDAELSYVTCLVGSSMENHQSSTMSLMQKEFNSPLVGANGMFEYMSNMLVLSSKMSCTYYKFDHRSDNPQNSAFRSALEDCVAGQELVYFLGVAYRSSYIHLTSTTVVTRILSVTVNREFPEYMDIMTAIVTDRTIKGSELFDPGISRIVYEKSEMLGYIEVSAKLTILYVIQVLWCSSFWERPLMEGILTKVLSPTVDDICVLIFHPFVSNVNELLVSQKLCFYDFYEGTTDFSQFLEDSAHITSVQTFALNRVGSSRRENNLEALLLNDRVLGPYTLCDISHRNSMLLATTGKLMSRLWHIA